MISTGIIVEYNPFHNGHKLHLDKSRELTNAEVIIAVMSGNFLQRGEPALLTKFSRTKMALLAGCDLVIELPYAFATQKAQHFAEGSVSILTTLGVNYLCFGSESGSIESFNSTVQFMKEEKDALNKWINKFMNEGMSYPKATSEAFKKLNAPSSIVDLSKPNNILGYHYMKAIDDLNSPIIGWTIERTGSGYHDPNLSPLHISSATSIRNKIFETNFTLNEIAASVPETTYEELNNFLQDYEVLMNWERLWPLLQFRLIQANPDELRMIYEVEEGIEYRMIEMAKKAESFHQFMNLLKTKRYTWTRLQRICTHVLTNTKKIEMNKKSRHPEYIRLLGMSKKGQKYLNSMKEKINIPIISRLSRENQKLLELDIRASQIYALGFPSQQSKKLIELEYKQPPIII